MLIVVAACGGAAGGGAEVLPTLLLTRSISRREQSTRLHQTDRQQGIE